MNEPDRVSPDSSQMPESIERERIARCLAGDLDAFGDLVRPYQDRLFNMLYRLVGRREDATELLQEALIRAFRGLGNFQQDSSFYTWMYRIAVNVALTNRRKRGRPVVSLEDLGTNRTFEIADDRSSGNPAQRMEQHELRAMIEHALADVPDIFRAVLVLKDIEGMKYEEIAEVLDVPVGTVRSRLHRARREMRDRLQPLLDKDLL